MSRLMITSDLHLGHKNIHNYRTKFSSAEHHHEAVFDLLASSVQKRDSLIFLGDVAFNRYWLEKIKSIKCQKKLLICGNHDTENGINMRDLVNVYDDAMALHCRKNYWFSHCPIHPKQFRGRVGNIHGHLHGDEIHRRVSSSCGRIDMLLPDERYLNVCVEHTDYKPVSFAELVSSNSKRLN